MKTKTDVSVIIDGKPLKLSGYESEEYLQKIASYINGKSAELKSMDGYRMLDNDIKNSLMKINIADDYFKMKKTVSDLSDERDNQDEEIFGLKHDIIELKKELDELKQKQKEEHDKVAVTIKAAQKELVDEQKKSVKLETENEGLKKTLAEGRKLNEKLEKENNDLRNENAMLKRRLQK